VQQLLKKVQQAKLCLADIDKISVVESRMGQQYGSKHLRQLAKDLNSQWATIGSPTNHKTEIVSPVEIDLNPRIVEEQDKESKISEL
jgi:hypothetical protein